jgi:hypothetical protein
LSNFLVRNLVLASVFLLLPVALFARAKPGPVPIKVRNLTFIGATQITPAEQEQIAAEVEKLDPRRIASAGSLDEIGERLRYVLQERGYFKARQGIPM